MNIPVDLTNLREITGGNKKMEAALFKEFISSCDSYILELSKVLDVDKKETWYTISHAFKGISINIGAKHLGELCREAQDNNAAPLEKKTVMLKDIEQEYSEVKKYLTRL